MPHNKALQALIDDPSNWMMGEVGPPGIGAARGARGIPQVMPTARDAVEMLKRLQGGLTKVPTSARQLIESTPVNQSVKDLMHPSAQAVQERMFQQANPIFRQMQEQGLFRRGR